MGKDKDDGGDNLSGEDRRLWDFVTRSIRPLDKPKKLVNPRVLPGATGKKQPDSRQAEPERFHIPAWKIPGFGLKPVEDDTGPGQNGIDRRTADRLKRGEMTIDGRLDLHGMRQGEAQDRLTRFILESHASDRRCLLVITGKGNRFSLEQDAGVLRRMLPVWISMTPLAPLVLMHSKARPKDGGDGAFYILLRRRR
ncbi:MAG: Smr domain protein [Micavibrio sp.]|nr:Smr domain protein [Micavibrio sp.]